jgi:hypothetical protein
MVPTKEDFDGYVNKAKSVGQDSLKEIETQSKKMLDRVEQARREGKSQADAFISGLKDGQFNPWTVRETSLTISCPSRCRLPHQPAQGDCQEGWSTCRRRRVLVAKQGRVW